MWKACVRSALKAQAWGGLVEKYGHEYWIQPLLDELGPVIQVQLVDAADYLKILANFYRCAWPRKTAATLWFFSICLLISLVADMVFCMKIVRFTIGGSFFFTYPIATIFPQYRRLLSAWRWFVWAIPTDAEWGIEKLQEKVLERQYDIFSLHERSAKESHNDDDYSTPETSPNRLPSRKFRVYQGTKPGSLAVSHKGLTFRLDPRGGKYPFLHLLEMRKVHAAKKMKVRALKPHPESTEFHYLDEAGLEPRGSRARSLSVGGPQNGLSFFTPFWAPSCATASCRPCGSDRQILGAWQPVPPCLQFDHYACFPASSPLLLPLPTPAFSTIIMAKRNATAEELLARAKSNGYKRGERGHTPSRGAPCQYLAGGADCPCLLPAGMCPPAVHRFA